jgi:hypothetical protein
VFRNLGYFVQLKDVPEAIKFHIARCFGHPRLPSRGEVDRYDESGSQRVHLAALRKYLGVKPYSEERDGEWLAETARQAAVTKHEIPDVINVLLEELVRHAFELPAFNTLERVATRMHHEVNDQYLGKIAAALTPDARATIDRLLKRQPDQALTGWQALKREPGAPSPQEARLMLQHIEGLTALAEQMPSVDVPIPKLRHFRSWVRALDATQLARLTPTRRYGLAVIFIHSQRGQALDDIVETYLRLMRNLKNQATRLLTQYQLEHGDRVDELVLQLKHILLAYKAEGSEVQRLMAIDRSLGRT